MTAGAMLLAGATVAGAALSPDTAGKTTVQQRIVPADASPGFRHLALGPGEAYSVRQDLGVAKNGRAGRRRALAYFGQLSDFQLADEESPARVEPLDPIPSFSSAFRPWEPLNPHIDDSMIRQMNSFAGAALHPNGNATRRPMDFTINTGDAADSQQFNETLWVRQLVEGGAINPGSGIVEPPDYDNPFCAEGNPNITADPGVDAPLEYTGVQDFGDTYDERDYYYDPAAPAGQFADFPTYPNLVDRAQVPFTAAGLTVPHYVAIGNHDGLVQGNLAATTLFERIATGCIKVETVAFESGRNFLNFNEQDVIDAYNAPYDDTDPNAFYVPPDPERRFVSKAQYKAIFQGGSQADGHGFDYVNPQENAAANGAVGYYAFTPVAGVRMIALDTVSEGGALNLSSEGNLDHPQFLWLERELKKATQRDQLVILYSHHAPASFQETAVPDEDAPACTAPDAHNHDVNPGCDVDPRPSTPIHLEDSVVGLLHQYPHVIAWVAGHSHEHKIQPYTAPGGKSGFWVVRTAAEADWPQQARLLELFDNEDGTLSLFGTVIDHASNATAPPSGTDAATLDTNDLASIGRTLSYNDIQSGARKCAPTPCGENAAVDRNVELLIKDPRRNLRPGRCVNPLTGTSGPDVFTGSRFGDRIRGFADTDLLHGRKGADCILGGAARDRVFGERGDDALSGNAGNDLVHGSYGKDKVRGQDGKDRLIGGKGPDRLVGGDGNDTLLGGDGSDRVFGGAGDDRIDAREKQRDVVSCGAGRDRAIADPQDVLRGCEVIVRP